MSDTPKRRLTASEREGLVRLSVALEIIHAENEALRERSKMIPGARRELAMMAKKMFKLMSQFADTIPDEQRLSYSRTLEGTSYTIGMMKPVHKERDEKKYGMWIPYEVLRAMFSGCEDHCLMCPSDKAQRRACKLRKAMETIPNDAPLRDDGDCPFYTLI